MVEASAIADLGIDENFDEIARGLNAGSRFQVTGPIGSGRSTLARRLAAELGAVLVEPPQLDDDDAIAHALLQAGRKAGVTVNGSSSIRESVAFVAENLLETRRSVVLRLPTSWRFDRKEIHPHRQRMLDRAQDFVSAWFDNRDLAIVLVADRTRGMPRTQHRVRLREAFARTSVLENRDFWGAYADHARSLRSALGTTGVRPSPVSLRLAVGLVALGEPADRVAQRLFLNEPPGDIVAPAFSLAAKLRLGECLRRFTEIRVSVPIQWVADIVRCPDEHLPLFTRCLGYGESSIRISSSVRSALQDKLKLFTFPYDEVEQTHDLLAIRHEGEDGLVDPNQTSPEGIVSWLEKVHHLAHSGEAGADRWSRQVIDHRELFWERARVLSKVRKDYLGGARLYERCLEIDDEDAYAWHYLGFNLDRAGVERELAEEAYRKAIDLEPSNPWWNSRYITFLIDQARFSDADEAWLGAMRAIDPDGDETHHDPNLALNIHRWVARNWLIHGEVKRARRVLDRILPRARTKPEIEKVEHLVSDAEETVALGASVRPAEMPLDRRWTHNVLGETDADGTPLSRWFPGRVVKVDSRAVHIVFAVPDDEPLARRVMSNAIPISQWKTWSPIAARSASTETMWSSCSCLPTAGVEA